tara:strand:- start:1795 stop:2013 length:219 start_codon:yes stop_codon:yes gene_type:complete
MKAQLGYVSIQLHKGVADRSTYLNYALWQDVESFRSAFNHPELQTRIADYPQSAVSRPHLFRKLVIVNHRVS